jgi:thioredoxin 2
MAPAFEAAAAELEPRVRVAKVDADAEPQLAARSGIRAIPTVILLRGAARWPAIAAQRPGPPVQRWVDQHVGAPASAGD